MRLPNLPNNFGNQQRPVIVRPPRRRRRRRFRWGLILVPAALLTAMWLASHITIGFSWDDLLHSWGIKNTDRFTNLAALAVVITAIVAIARVLHKDKEE